MKDIDDMAEVREVDDERLITKTLKLIKYVLWIAINSIGLSGARVISNIV